MDGTSRRKILRLGAGAVAGLGAGRRARVAAVRGADLAEMTRAALAALGGIQTIVHEGETVFVKPNMVTLPWSARDYNPSVSASVPRRRSCWRWPRSACGREPAR